MKTQIVARHGDVLIERILDENELDSKQSFVEVEKITLAEGEVTGHHHELMPTLHSKIEVLASDVEEADKVNYNVNELSEAIFKVKGGRGILTHQEHEPIVLEEGVYRKRIQREYDPFEKRLRKVLD